MSTTIPTSLYDLTADQLADQLAAWGQPAFHAKQIRRWLYQQFVAHIDEMTDLSKTLRAQLSAHYALGRLIPVAEHFSSDGWTRKWLLRLPDGSEIETVLMEYDGIRRTACISSQAGCAMDCAFCATGQMGFVRNLRAGEIIEQVLWVARAMRHQSAVDRLSNVVFMGMGEPFANYNNVLEAIRRLTEPQSAGGFGLGARRITVSTVGIVPGIRRFAEEALQVNLAISLHAANDELRNQLVPLNKRYPLKDLALATREYIRKTNRRVSFEWALIDGVNDTVEQARLLVKFIRSIHDPQQEGRNMIHVNMIPLNPTAGYAGRATDRERARHFSAILAEAGIPNTIRVRRGIDIHAGCGQLKAAVSPDGEPAAMA
ncbi:MAG: 23S rRNA (adenine(2503)-C(2))-methyltransferase RlmN [Anaerolineae bacterium]|nr:23S rRNA (adenine(2503)-C(2))-methyltransferase RlmN [Thermoflexales bacterium]MDW8406416.1 23S rRNA (adenine(2503)-C(2))-methyltransferase RlmN [Anaerolineae bacterium]